MAWLSRFPVDRPYLLIAEPDGNSNSAEARVERYLPRNEEYDTYPVVLEQGYIYDIVVYNDGSGVGLRGNGIYGLWTNDWLLNYAGELIQYQEWSDPWPGTGYNGDFFGFKPQYSGLYHIVVQKDYALYYDAYEGSYGIAIYARYDVPGPLSDFVNGNSWADTIPGYDGHDTLLGNGGDDFIQGWSGNDSILGGDGNDFIHAGLGNDDINGNTGNDRIDADEDDDIARGGQGNDVISGGNGNDWHLNGNIGNDTVYGNNGNDFIYGGPGEDFLQGFLGDDVLTGDLGNDTLAGDAGSDRYRGGGGADTFIFAAGSGIDAVDDFNPAEDVLSISKALLGNPADPLAALSDISANVDGNLRITFTSTDRVTVAGMSVSDLAVTPLVFW